MVVINQYYEPFDPSLDCLTSIGLTRDKIDILLLDPHGERRPRQRRGDLRLPTVQPDFTGHELCTDQSYVQGATIRRRCIQTRAANS